MSFLDALTPTPAVPVGFTHAMRPGQKLACGQEWPMPRQTAKPFSVFRQNVTCPACIKVLDQMHVFNPADPWLGVHDATWPQARP